MPNNPVRLSYIVGALVAGLIIWWGLATALESYHAREASHGEAQAQQQHGEAITHANNATASDAHVQSLQTANAGLQTNVDRLKQENAILRKRLASQPLQPIPSVDGSGELVPISAVNDRDAVISKQDQIIKAQDAVIAGKDEQIKGLTLSRDEWKAAYEHEQKAREAQAVATEAWKSAVKESRWRGRIEGFAVGVATGYLGGKL